MGSEMMPLVLLTAMVMAVPGPSVAFAVTQRLQGGPAVGAWGVIGLETGLLVHVIGCVLGVSALIATSPATLTGIKVGGATYLAILGGRQVMASRHVDAVELATAAQRHTAGGSASTPRAERGRAFRGGLLVDLLNPKTVIFVLALLPQFVQSDQGRWRPVLAGGIVVALGLIADLTWMLLAGWLWSDRPSARRERWTHALTGTAFLGFACVLAAH